MNIQNIEQNITLAHNTLMQVMVNGEGTIRMAEALTLLRQAVQEIREGNAQEEAKEETK